MNKFIASMLSFLNAFFILIGVIASIFLGTSVSGSYGPIFGFFCFFIALLIVAGLTGFIAFLSAIRADIQEITRVLEGLISSNSSNLFSEKRFKDEKFIAPEGMKGASQSPQWIEQVKKDVDAEREFKRVSNWSRDFADVFAYRYLNEKINAIQLANELSKIRKEL